MLPDLSFAHIIVLGLVALIVVGPKDLPVLMRRIGQFIARMRGIANEFRASFDDMARQSELEELRREVEALRSGQAPIGEKPLKERLDDRDAVRRAEITDIYSSLEQSGAQLHPPMSYQYSEEMVGLTPETQQGGTAAPTASTASGSPQTPAPAPAAAEPADDDIYALSPVGQGESVQRAAAPHPDADPARWKAGA
jgi:sec-independent protein translocase protein TatB